jgi:hypothetical protein
MILECRAHAINPLIGRHFNPNADLATKRFDFVQRLVQVYRPKTFCGAPIAVTSNEVSHLGLGILGG